MRRREVLVTVFSICLVSACSESTGPSYMDSAIRVEPLATLRAVGLPNSEVADLPAVRITNYFSGEALAGRTVVFTLTAPGGEKTSVTRSTDSDGVARLSQWRLGSALGQYTAIAVTDGWGSVSFTVTVPGGVVAIYDLKSINGIPLPIPNEWKKEAHYVLYESGMQNNFVNRPASAFSPSQDIVGSYRRLGSDALELTMFCYYTSPHCIPRSMLATLRGNEMIVDDGDPFYGPHLEVYLLRPLEGVGP